MRQVWSGKDLNMPRHDSHNFSQPLRGAANLNSREPLAMLNIHFLTLNPSKYPKTLQRSAHSTCRNLVPGTRVGYLPHTQNRSNRGHEASGSGA